MTACRDVGKWITEKVRKPVEKFISKAEEACTEARKWVEREVRKPIERRRTRTEKKCKKRKCKWWCACCNKWFCWLETIIERFIEWVIEVIGEWLVETVCKIVIKVIKIIVEIVITVVRFVVVGVICLFTEPRGALDALIDLWYDITDIISDVGDLISDLLGAVSDLLDLTKEFILDLGDMLGPIGRFFLGIVAGVLDIVRRVVDGAKRIVDGVFDIVVGILHLDFCTALEGLVNGVGFGLGQAALGVTGVTSLASNGVRDGIERQSLREWLQDELDERFDDGDLGEQLSDLFQMDSSSFGISWPVQPLRCTISSRSDDYDLKALHDEGIFNLFEIGGYAPFGCKETPVNRSVYRLVYKDTDYRVSLGDLRAYLNHGPDEAPEFVLVAGDKRVFKDMLAVAERKMRQMAIELDIAPLDTFELKNIPVAGNADNELTIGSATPLAERITTDLGLSDICDLPAVVVFKYTPSRFGLASAFWRGEQRKATAATVRTSFMAHLFGTVLAHEMGHCFSLEHEGHEGMENIMFTLADIGDPGPEDDLDAVTAATFIEFIMIGGEPRFTLEDGKNAWLWILNEAFECIRARL